MDKLAPQRLFTPRFCFLKNVMVYGINISAVMFKTVQCLFFFLVTFISWEDEMRKEISRHSNKYFFVARTTYANMKADDTKIFI